MDRSQRGEPAERLKVMVVDDNQDIRSLLSLVLKRDGLEMVAMVDNGQDAVHCAMEHQPDVVVLDFMMPGIDGAETARFLRAAAPRAMIIAFSGVILERPEWADDFLPKGGVGDLAEMVERIIRVRDGDVAEDEPAAESSGVTLSTDSAKSFPRWA